MKLFKLNFICILLIVLLTACENDNSASHLSSGYINYNFQENVVKSGDLIDVVYFKSEVKAGSYGEIVVCGEPNTEYKITVKYKDNISKSKSLVNKISDKNGIVSWSWKTSAKTKPGTYKVEITQGAELVVQRNFNLY